MVDQLVSTPLPGPQVQLANLLAWLRTKSGDAAFTAVELPSKLELASIVGAVDAATCIQLLEWAQKDGLVNLTDGERKATLTPKGWGSAATPEVTPLAIVREPAQSEAAFGHCPQCGPKRRAQIVASHTEHSEDDESLIWSADTYNILKCAGCDAVYVQRTHVFSEDEDYDQDPVTGEVSSVLRPTVTYWPSPAKRERPRWLEKVGDRTLRDLMEEVYGALDSDHRVLAAIGTRTAIDRALILLGANESSSFSGKLADLRNAGTISQDEMGMLLVLTDAGSAAAHRGWRPSPEELSTILDGTEALLHRSFVLRDAVAAVKQSVPNRPSRTK